MKVTATDLATDSQSILDRVVEKGEIAEIQRHGKTVAEIRRKFGADRKEMVELLKGVNFTQADTRELKQAMDAAAEVLGYAGRD
jgi:antitoxin (DNA-binding transcriptional repressor) of toxin-antitoxin stability system